MKKKELKNIAQRIAIATLIIEKNEDVEKVEKAKQEILKLSSKINNLEDLLEIDIYVQEILEKS